MPKHPAVNMHVFAHDQSASGAAAGFVPFMEGTVRLRCLYHGEEGWFVLTIGIGDRPPDPTERQGSEENRKAPAKWIPAPFLRSWPAASGQPGWLTAGRVFYMNREVTSAVYFAEISLQTSPRWKAEVKRDGAPFWGLEFVEGLGHEMTPRQRIIWQQEFRNAPVYHRLVESSTTVLQAQRRSQAVPSRWRPKEDGIVRVSVDPQAPWARLMPARKKVLGRIGYYRGGADMPVVRLSMDLMARPTPVPLLTRKRTSNRRYGQRKP